MLETVDYPEDMRRLGNEVGAEVHRVMGDLILANKDKPYDPRYVTAALCGAIDAIVQMLDSTTQGHHDADGLYRALAGQVAVSFSRRSPGWTPRHVH